MNCIDHNRTKSLAPDGYALVTRPRARSTAVGLHRLVYCEAHNLQLEDIAGKVIRHTCDNPRCINPEHLIIGTMADNNRDRALRGRSAKKVPSRRTFTEEQIQAIRSRYKKHSKVDGAPAIAREYGVHHTTIHYIIKGKLYV